MNNNFVPGSFNPATQIQSDGDYWIAQNYSGFSDPTQVPMHHGDTERVVFQQPSFPQASALGDLDKIKQLLLALTNQSVVIPQQPVQGQNVISQPQISSQPRKLLNTSIGVGGVSEIPPIRVPLSFDLQFNITVNLNIKPIQNDVSEQPE